MDDELLGEAEDPGQAGGKGAAFGAMVATVDNVPGDPDADRARAIAEADENIKAAQRKVAKQKAHLAKAPKGDKKDRQAQHLEAAELALEEARAARERIT